MDGINSGITPATSVREAQKIDGLSPKDALRLRKASADFESMFVKQMLSAMRKAVPREKDGMFKESEGEKIFKDMLDNEYAKTTSHSGSGMGLGAAMYKQLVARYGQNQGQGIKNVPTVAEAQYKVDQLRREGSAMSAAGQGRIGNIGGKN